MELVDFHYNLQLFMTRQLVYRSLPSSIMPEVTRVAEFLDRLAYFTALDYIEPDDLRPTEITRHTQFLGKLTRSGRARELMVTSLQLGNSFDISFSGIGGAIERIVDAVDPITREQRKAELDHLRKMNELAYRAAEREDVSANTLAVVRRFRLLVKYGYLTEDEARSAVIATLAAQNAASTVLQNLGVTRAIEKK